MKKRSHKIEKLARIYDAEVLPIWSERFGRLLLRGLDVPEHGQVLDVACGTGYPAVELLRRMGPGCRLIAIDGASAMLEVARKKISEIDGAKQKVFFRTESAEPKLSFADDVYDLVVCNLGLEDFEDPAAGIADFARVTVPGGEVRCTLPLSGTFQEFFDMYREVLTKHDKHDAIERLNDFLRRYPTVSECESWMSDAGMRDCQVDVVEFSMLFKSSREFFFAPVIEYGPLADWKAIAGDGQEMQDVFWYIKEAIDAYFGGRAFEVTVKAGCLTGTVRAVADEDVTGRVAKITSLQAVADLTDDLQDDLQDQGAAPGQSMGEIAAASVAQMERSQSLEPPELPPAPDPTGTEEISIEELEELEMETLDNAEPVLDENVIHAFVDGAERPPHLDNDDNDDD